MQYVTDVIDMFEAKDLIGLLVAKCGDRFLDDLAYVIAELASMEKECEARGQILDTARGYAQSIGYTGGGWRDAIDFLAEKAGINTAPF